METHIHLGDSSLASTSTLLHRSGSPHPSAILSSISHRLELQLTGDAGTTNAEPSTESVLRGATRKRKKPEDLRAGPNLGPTPLRRTPLLRLCALPSFALTFKETLAAFEGSLTHANYSTRDGREPLSWRKSLQSLV
jgi:hypothetical protein